MLTGLIFAMRMAICQETDFFFHRNNDLYSLFYPRLSLILSCCLNLRLSFLFEIFVKCFWQFDNVKFYGWCYYKLAIIKPRAVCMPVNLLSVD